MTEKPHPVDIEKAFHDIAPIQAALRKGVRDAARRHKQAGVPMVIVRDGKTISISAEEFERELDDLDAARRAENVG